MAYFFDQQIKKDLFNLIVDKFLYNKIKLIFNSLILAFIIN